jgi:uncharacterized lipoprotein YddW (UPF0748 family)
VRALMIMMFAATAGAATLDTFDYKDSAALQAVWQGQGESRPAELTMSGDMVRAAKLTCNFSAVKDWRVYWDRDLQADLGDSEQLTLKVKSPDPSAVAQAVVYLKSGSGWYRLPAFSVGQDWETKVLNKSDAVSEDQPSSWSKIDRIRIAFTPSLPKKDTVVEVAELAARAGWPLSYVGSVGGYADLKEADKGLQALAKGRPCAKDVGDRLREAKAILARAESEKDQDSRQDLILEGRAKTAQAYALVQDPKPGEFRCVWVHNGDGIRALGSDRVMTWKEALPVLKAAGFNAVAPNMLWSGTAFYPSKVVPVNHKVKEEGDYLQQILDAAKPLGMQVHVWKVMWQLGEDWISDPGVLEPFRKRGKLQVDLSGKERPWLCPCDDENRAYELAAILEAANYPIDGIHLDYIRFSGQDVSYSKMCRKRFESSGHMKVAHWPQDCAPGGARFEEYAAFKREVITSFVREVRRELKKKRPSLQLSAAVFAYPGIARDSVSQDWPTWAKEGIVDWLSTMTYTEDSAGFIAAIKAQQQLMGPRTRLYPGIGVTYEGGRVVALDTLVDEIKGLRSLGLGGFNLFEFRDQLRDTVLPYLSAGLLREGDYALNLRETPAYARVAVPQRGRALDASGPSLLIDDFESGSLVNKLRSPWSAVCDSGNLGTTLSPQPLQLMQGGAKGSAHALGISGHMGKNRAPWPYALLSTGFNPASEPTDLSAYKALVFMAKGNGKNYEVVMAQDAVKDYGYYRCSFVAGKEWAEVRLPLKNFIQSPWASPVKRSFVDVKYMEFQPSGLDDADYDLAIDDVRLVK